MRVVPNLVFGMCFRLVLWEGGLQGIGNICSP